jgi:hypothetical protein
MIIIRSYLTLQTDRFFESDCQVIDSLFSSLRTLWGNWLPLTIFVSFVANRGLNANPTTVVGRHCQWIPSLGFQECSFHGWWTWSASFSPCHFATLIYRHIFWSLWRSYIGISKAECSHCSSGLKEAHTAAKLRISLSFCHWLNDNHQLLDEDQGGCRQANIYIAIFQ